MSITASVTLSKMIIPGLLLLSTLLSGVWVSALGRPLNALVFGLHKMIAVATIFIVGRQVVHLYQALGARGFIEGVLIAVAALLFLAVVVSGSFLSFERPAPPAFLKIHQIIPVLAVVAAVSSLYLLLSSRA